MVVMRGALAAQQPWRRAVDRWAVVYVLVTGLLPLLDPAVFSEVPTGPPLGLGPHIALHLGLAALLWVLPPWLRSRESFAPRLLAEITVPLLFPLFYSELAYLGQIYFNVNASFDPWLIDIEQSIFGGQPSLLWSERMPWPWLHEYFEFAYFSYYLFAAGALFMIWRLGDATRDERWRHTTGMVRDLVAVMLTCYAWYIVLPVWGPKYFAKIGVAGPVEVGGGIFTRIMHYIHAHGALHGAAFPSSHVAGSMVPWWWTWRLFPRQRWWTTALWLSLCASIIYCRYHYGVDLIGGVLWGALVIGASRRFRDFSS